MRDIDMSAKAVTARLKLMSQLRQLGVSLSKAKLKPVEKKPSFEATKRPTISK